MMNPKAKGWITAVGMLASVFFAGLLAGVAVAGVRDAPRSGPQDGPPPREVRERDGRGGGGGPGRRSGGVTPLLPPRMIEELGLSDDQRARVAEVLDRRRAESEAILQTMGPRLRAQLDSGHQEIRALLDPEQQETFDRLFQQMRSRRPRGGPGRAPPGGR